MTAVDSEAFLRKDRLELVFFMLQELEQLCLLQAPLN